jgi:hypothetical protein
VPKENDRFKFVKIDFHEQVKQVQYVRFFAASWVQAFEKDGFKLSVGVVFNFRG